MPLRDWKFRIQDILGAVHAVREYTQGMNFKFFIEDRKTVDAVVRNLIIIGEAAIQIPEEVCRQEHADKNVRKLIKKENIELLNSALQFLFAYDCGHDGYDQGYDGGNDKCGM